MRYFVTGLSISSSRSSPPTLESSVSILLNAGGGDDDCDLGGWGEEGKKKEVWEKGGGQGCLTIGDGVFVRGRGHSHF